MNVNIYYGGRGLVDDPTIVVINRIQEVLEELNVHVTRYNLYEIKNTITTLSQSVVEADGVVFATTVEWVGMGGYMQTLLDSCWLYADKSRTSSTYMFPVVMSRAYGEREVVTALSNSWEIIGGVVGESLSAYVDDTTDFEFNNEYKEILEKNGMVFSGINTMRNLMEIIEIPTHKHFIACQFHPEFKSRPNRPHPLFTSFIKASIEFKN